MAMKVLRFITWVAAIASIASGFIMAGAGKDYMRGSFMLIGGFGIYLVLQVGAIYEIVRDIKKKIIYKP